MNFSEYLRAWIQKDGLRSSRDLYKKLGAKSVLGVALRRFYQFETGTDVPTFKTFCAFFAHVPVKEKRPILMAYMKSLVQYGSATKEILDLFETHLLPPPSPTARPWLHPRNQGLFSVEQLTFLATNPIAMRIHKYLLLTEKPLSRADVPIDIGKKLVSLGLAELEKSKDCYLATKKTFRVPRREDSNPRSVAKANEYIAKHIDTFLALEGNDNQELLFSSLMIEPEDAKKAFQQIQSFRTWLRSLKAADSSTTAVPMVSVDFLKVLEARDFK